MLPTTNAENALAAFPIAWAARLIERMQALYGAKFAQQWEGIAPARLAEIWAEELAGFNGDEISTGLHACRARPFPPTLPEFLRLCRPWTDPEVAHGIAVAGMSARRKGAVGVWPHPAIYWAAVAVGRQDLLAMTYGAIRARWEAALRDEQARGQWAVIPAPAEALPAPGATVTTNAEGERKVKALVEQAIQKGEKIDHRAWARRILVEQERKGGRRYAMAVLATARRALGIEQEGNAA